jgi:hypothetical protein
MAASSRTRSGPNVSFERGHRDRLIAPTMKKVSPGLSPTAAAIIHKAQAGRFSIPHVPPLHRRGGWRGDSQQPVNSCPITKPTTSRCSGNGDPEGADNFRDPDIAICAHPRLGEVRDVGCPSGGDLRGCRGRDRAHSPTNLTGRFVDQGGSAPARGYGGPGTRAACRRACCSRPASSLSFTRYPIATKRTAVTPWETCQGVSGFHWRPFHHRLLYLRLPSFTELN